MKKLLKIINESADSILSGSLSSEAQVKQSIIVPILRGLGWAETNPVEFKTEFKILYRKGTVDYALCGKGGKPLIFIEAKKLGKANDIAKKQLLDYAADQQVPFLILTDGRIWYFYLGKTKGVTIDQYFYRMDFSNDKENRKYAKFFKKYFYKDAIISGDSLKEAEQYYQSNKEKARNQIPKVWQAILRSYNTKLRDELVNGVEKECGIKPESNDVNNFLQEWLPSPRKKSPILSASPSPYTSKNQAPITGFILDGNSKVCKSGIKTLVGVLMEFHNRDTEFMSRFASQMGRTKRKKRVVARSREELYDTSHLSQRNSYYMENGWWLGTNFNTKSIRKIIKEACEVAGITFGLELTLIELGEHQERTPASASPPSENRVKITGFILDGNRKEFKFGIMTLAGVLMEFHNRDAEFMSRFAPQVEGTKQRLVARSHEGLFDSSSRAKKRAYDMENGWWLRRNISTKNIRKYTKIACEVAGITFGSQLTLIEDRKHKER